MQKILILLSLFLAVNAFGQTSKSYKKQIKKHRKHYKADFLKEERSPFYGKKKEMKKMAFYAADETYNVACTFERTPDAKPFDMATYSGKVKQFVTYGILKFQIDGKEHRLAVYQNLTLRKMKVYADHLFIPFKDPTNNVETYGGGRYIDLKKQDLEGENIMLDFNKCYNPWCAFSDGYNCPVPPKENHLSVVIRAGEKKFKGNKH